MKQSVSTEHVKSNRRRYIQGVKLQAVVEDVKVDGFVIEDRGNWSVIQITSPDKYASVGQTYLVAHNHKDRTAEAIAYMKQLCLTIKRIEEVISSGDSNRRNQLRIALKRTDNKAKRMEDCYNVVERWLRDGIVPCDDAKPLLATLHSELRYWQNQATKEFHAIFEDELCGVSFCTVPKAFSIEEA